MGSRVLESHKRKALACKGSRHLSELQLESKDARAHQVLIPAARANGGSWRSCLQKKADGAFHPQ